MCILHATKKNIYVYMRTQVYIYNGYIYIYTYIYMSMVLDYVWVTYIYGIGGKVGGSAVFSNTLANQQLYAVATIKTSIYMYI